MLQKVAALFWSLLQGIEQLYLGHPQEMLPLVMLLFIEMSANHTFFNDHNINLCIAL